LKIEQEHSLVKHLTLQINRLTLKKLVRDKHSTFFLKAASVTTKTLLSHRNYLSVFAIIT
jgi:hypothetical protein